MREVERNFLRVQGRHQPAGHRRLRNPGDESARGAAQGGRVRPRISQRERRRSTDAEPEVLGRNGSYVVFRKLYTREAAFRQFLRARANERGR